MDRSATSRSVPMRRGAALSDSRSGSCLRGRSRDRGSDGDYPSAHGTTFAVAKRSHRTLYRIRAAGVPRSRHHLQRQRPTTHLEIVHGILRTVAHALGTSEGRTGFATCLTDDHCRIIAIPQVRGLHHRYERGRVINSIIHSCERRYAVATALRRNSRFPSWLVGKPCSSQTESPTNRCHTCPMDPRSSFQQRQAVRAGDSVHMTPTVMRSRPTVGGS